MRRKSLPPLDSLIFFEAAARLNSFTLAAEELFVTQAAVSKRIRQLEEHLGSALFKRIGRKLFLTDRGELLREKVSMGLDYFDAVFSEFSARQQTRVSVASNSAVTMFWLMPRVKEFSLSEASCQIDLGNTDNQEDLIQGDNDLIVIYDRKGEVPGWNASLLFPEILVPVVHPDILKADSRLKEAPLLDYTRLAPDWSNWGSVLPRMDAPDLVHRPVARCRSFAHTIGAAVRGEGIALGSLYLLHNELANGTLAVLGNQRYETGLSYYLCHRAGLALSAESRAFCDYLLAGLSA